MCRSDQMRCNRETGNKGKVGSYDWSGQNDTTMGKNATTCLLYTCIEMIRDINRDRNMSWDRQTQSSGTTNRFFATYIYDKRCKVVWSTERIKELQQIGNTYQDVQVETKSFYEKPELRTIRMWTEERCTNVDRERMQKHWAKVQVKRRNQLKWRGSINESLRSN